MQERLDATDRVDAALAGLAAHGIAGVKIQMLAKQLQVTKGSFY